MSRAVLEIAADTSGIEAAFGRIRTEAVRIEALVRSTTRSAAGEQTRSYRESARTQANEARRGAAASEREAHRAVLAFVRGEEQRRRAAQLTTAARERAESDATRIAQDEARKRGLSAEQEARVRMTALQRYTREFEREERRQTNIARNEERQRARATGAGGGADARSEARGRMRSGAGQVAASGFAAAQQYHGMVQDARRSRAEADRALRFAISGADNTATEASISASRDTVRAFARREGIPYEEAVESLRQGQEAGSILERQGSESSEQALQRALRSVSEARAFGTDAGGYLTAQGRLRAAGLSGDALTQAVRYAATAANAGAIEVGTLMQQGLPGATRLMSQRVNELGPQATEAQRQQAMLNAFRESVATQEVAAAAGGTSRQTSNTLATLSNFLATPARQQQVLTNLQHEVQATARTPEGERRRAALQSLYQGENALFERDPTRSDPNAMRLRQGVSAIELSSRVAAAMGGDSARAANIFAGGGTGNAQALLSNMRDLMTLMGGERGRSIREMMARREYTQDDVSRREETLRNDELSRIIRSEEEGRNALTDNTDKLKLLSDKIQDFMASHPGVAAVAGQAPGILAGLGGLITGGMALLRTRGAQVAATLTEGAAGAATTVAATARGAAPAVARAVPSIARTANPVGLLTTLLSFGGGFSGTDFEQTQRRSLEGFVAGAAPDRQAVTRRAGEGLIQQGQPITAESIGRAVAQALRENPLTATVSPTDAQHAATQAAPAAGRR